MRHALRPLPLLVSVVAALALLACADRTKRQDTIKAATITVNAARDGFTTWSTEHQMDLVQKAKSREEVQAKVEAFRKAREPVISAITDVYLFLLYAAVHDDSPSLDSALKAARDLVEMIGNFRKHEEAQ
jgi:hypothetical protein